MIDRLRQAPSGKCKGAARRIMYVHYGNPALYPPLEHSSRILANAGWRVVVLGSGTFDADLLRFPVHTNITVRQLSSCPTGWQQKLHYARFALWVLILALRWRPTWVYASDPLSSPVALMLSYWPRLRVIYHEHDSPTAMPADDAEKRDLDPGISRFMRLILWSRRRLAERARLCVLPNQRRAKQFAHASKGRAVLTVWNCPRREEVDGPRGPHRGEILRVLYHGSVVPPRLPPTVLTALSMVPDHIRLRVVGYETISHIGYVSELREMASRLGISKKVEFVGPVPRRYLLQCCRECDVGLAFVPRCHPDVRNMVGASNKPFDYLACGLALLVENLPDWQAMYVDPGYGLACDAEKPESIAGALRWFLDHLSEMRAMGERGRQRIVADWNYERQFAPVFEALCEAET